MISPPPLGWWLALFIEGRVLFPNIRREGIHNDQFEGGKRVQVILTKGGFCLQKALVVTLPWAPRRPLSCRPAGLDLVAPIWKPLPDASGLLACACLFGTKEKTGSLRPLAPAWLRS